MYSRQLCHILFCLSLRGAYQSNTVRCISAGLARIRMHLVNAPCLFLEAETTCMMMRYHESCMILMLSAQVVIIKGMTLYVINDILHHRNPSPAVSIFQTIIWNFCHFILSWRSIIMYEISVPFPLIVPIALSHLYHSLSPPIWMSPSVINSKI